MNWLLQYLAQPTSSDTPPTRAQVREVKRKRPSENALTPIVPDTTRVQRAFPDGPAASRSSLSPYMYCSSHSTMAYCDSLDAACSGSRVQQAIPVPSVCST